MAVDHRSELSQDARVDVLFERLAELQGQRNAIDAQIVDVVRALDEDDLWGTTGCRSLEQCVAWKTGSSPAHARALAAVARRAETFPRCVGGLREGSLSLDQVAVIAERASDGSDDHYATLAESATVAQLRKALSLAPRPKTEPAPEPERSITKITDEEFALPITSGTGRTADRPSCGTSCSSVRSTTACTTAGSSPSVAPATPSP